MLTPFEHRKVVADAARKYPTQILPFGFVELDAPDVAQQVRALHDLGYRGLGELEFPGKPFIDRSYDPVYELANDYSWIVLFHTGIVLRQVFDRPEDISSGRMRPRAPRRDRAAVSAADGARRTLREPGVRVGRRGLSLEPQRLLRSQRIDAAEDAGTPEPLQDVFWWTASGQDTATPNKRSQRVHQARCSAPTRSSRESKASSASTGPFSMPATCRNPPGE
jgi:hypothetical protein